MIAGVIVRFVLAVTIVMVGGFPSTSLGADDAGALALSKALAQVELFEGLAEAEMEELKHTATLRRGQAGERLVEQGKSLGRMFIILDGQARILVNGKHIVTLSGQSLVGEIEFLDKLPASADVILINETDLIELDNGSLTALMDKQPRLGYKLMRRIALIECQRLRASTQR